MGSFALDDEDNGTRQCVAVVVVVHIEYDNYDSHFAVACNGFEGQRGRRHSVFLTANSLRVLIIG